MATATFTTVVDRSIGDPVTEAIWDDQLKDNVNQLAGAHQNLLTNGGFEVWQRGTGSFTSSGVYTADRWQMNVLASTMTVTQETTTIDGASLYALKIVNTGVGTNNLAQKIEDFRQLRGRTVSLSVRVNQGVSGAVTPLIQDTGGTTTGTTSSTTGSWVTLTATRAVDAATTSLTVTLRQITGSSTNYLDNAMLVIGPAPAPYQPLHPQEDLARCQRYYTIWPDGGATLTWLNGYNAAGTALGATWNFPVRMYGTPTVTKNGTWAVTNCGQPQVSTPSPAGVHVYSIITALGAANFGTNSSDDFLSAESNP